MSNKGVSIGIIGGSGIYDMGNLTILEERVIETPFGRPSGPLVIGEIEGTKVVFLARHGEGHRYTPSEVNYRANIWALKSLGVQSLIGISAVGSLKHEHTPGTLRLPAQYIDKTFLRASTFFGEGVVAHVGFAKPTCESLTGILLATGAEFGLPIETCGTYVCMEGPAFSTKAESALHVSMGADLIGMTQVTEAKLAREAEICFATIALVTDYDAWRDDIGAVDTHNVLAVMNENFEKVKLLVRHVVGRIACAEPSCSCRSALSTAIMTSKSHMVPATRSKLNLLIGKYGY